MKFGVHKMTWGSHFDPQNIKTFFQQARDIGADSVEFRPPDEVVAGNRVRAGEIRKMAEDCGLTLLFSFAYPPGADMRSDNTEERERAVQHLIRGIRAVQSLGGKAIGGVLYSSWPTCYDGDMLDASIRYSRIQRSIEGIRRVTPVAEACGVTLSLEPLNRYENYIINTVAEGIAFCKAVSSKNCKLLLDTYHMNIEEESVSGAILEAKGLIGHFHAAEPNRMIPRHTARIDWKEVGGALAKAGYDGTVTIEAAVALEGEVSYPVRVWRDLLPDDSLRTRLSALDQGLRYIRAQFGEINARQYGPGDRE